MNDCVEIFSPPNDVIVIGIIFWTVNCIFILYANWTYCAILNKGRAGMLVRYDTTGDL